MDADALAITWTNADQDKPYHMVSLGHNGSIFFEILPVTIVR